MALHSRARFTLSLLVVVTIIGILVARSVAGRAVGPRGGGRAQWANNVKQIGLATHLFNDHYKDYRHSSAGPVARLPVVSAPSFVILPFIELGNLYERVGRHGDP